jgi:penicillin V acylase-like amidase (Ntn superfamily)
MNETGLVVSLMRLNGSAAPVPDHRRWIWVQYWMQYVLDMCSSIDEVIAFDSTIRIVSDSRIPHYMITDHTGRCAVIEHINGKSVIYTGTSLPLKILANNPYKTSLDDWKDYTSQIPANRPISPSGTSSKSRFIRAGEAAAKFTPCDPDTAISRAFDLLFYASGQREKAPPPCWSLVFDSGRLRLYIKTILNRSTRYIDLGKLDFSCSSVVKMLDINSTMCGDISTALGNYDFTAHYSHALSAGRKWGLNMTPEFLEQRLRFFDSFQCRD